MPPTNSRYCVLGVHWADDPDNLQILCLQGQVVVVDTLSMAQELIPRLGGGRYECWDATREVCAFTPLVRSGINRITILTGYDPYDVPNGFRSKGIWSEALGRDWKHHVIWNQVFTELILWADDLAARFDPLLMMEPVLS